MTYWPEPDKDGDGDEVWYTRTDNDGNVIGRERKKDNEGNVLHHYSPPEGFQNFPSFDHTDNYVRVDGKGRVLRDGNGNALSISEGHALVEYPDGTSALLEDEYARYKFGQAHEKVSSDVPQDDSDGDENTTTQSGSVSRDTNAGNKSTTTKSPSNVNASTAQKGSSTAGGSR